MRTNGRESGDLSEARGDLARRCTEAADACHSRRRDLTSRSPYSLLDDEMVRYGVTLDDARHLLTATYGPDADEVAAVGDLDSNSLLRQSVSTHLGKVEVLLRGAAKNPERIRDLTLLDTDRQIQTLRGVASRSAVVTAGLSFFLSLIALGASLGSKIAGALGNWNSWMRTDFPLLPTFTWAQFFGGLMVGLLSAAIAAGVAVFLKSASASQTEG